MDGFSDNIINVALQNGTQGLVNKAFRDNWVNKIGTPPVMVPDNEFISSLFDHRISETSIGSLPDEEEGQDIRTGQNWKWTKRKS